MDVLERRFWQVSNPKNEDYGRYMTNEQITKLIGAEGSLARSFLERLTNEIFAQSGYRFSSIETGTRCTLNVNQERVLEHRTPRLLFRPMRSEYN